MNKAKRVLLSCTAALMGALLFEGSSSAVEPDDFNFASVGQHFGHISSYITPGNHAFFGNPDAIFPANDVDYHLISCGVAGKKITDLKILFGHASGDLDMAVYRMDGTFIASATSTTDDEIVTVSNFTNQNTVQLRVYGWAGATNNYNVEIFCQ